jgi:hypothetical protein
MVAIQVHQPNPVVVRSIMTTGLVVVAAERHVLAVKLLALSSDDFPFCGL